MATTTSNIQVVHTATLGAKSYENDTTYSIANIEELRDDQIRIPAVAEKTVYTFGAGATDSFADFDYILIQNTDTTNFITVGRKSGTTEVYDKVKPLGYLLITSDEIDANTAGGGFSAFVSVDTLTAQADTGDVFANITIGIKQ